MELIFNKLTELIKKYDNILIMTHKNPDFDGMGSAIALQQIIHSFNKKCAICMNKVENNSSLKKSYQLIIEKNLYFNVINNPKKIYDKTLLIILDTHKNYMVEYPNIINLCEEVVVIDHHLKSKEYIKTANINYINSNLSSIVEFITYYIKHLNKTVDSLIATILLVGLETDTFNYRLKTTANTYGAASFLANMGADNILKQELLQEDIEEYLKRKQLIESAQIINDKALCIIEKGIYEPKFLAEIAEELLQIENIQTSFVIGHLDNQTIGISARSIGKINVENIMVKMGGGGNFAEAATQINNSSICNVKKELLNILNEEEI